MGTGCEAVQVEKKPGTAGEFVCPNEPLNGGQYVAHTLHADDSDCRKFYICINRETPRVGGCDLGKVFSTESMVCELPHLVPECATYYDDVATNVFRSPSRGGR